MTRILCSTVALLFFSLPLHAAITEKTWSLSPYVGGYVFDRDQGPDRGSIAGVRLGYALSTDFGIETVYGRIRGEDEGGSKVSGRGNSYHLDLLYNLRPLKRLVPYLAVGAGMLDYRESGGSFHRPALNAGGGLRYALSDDLGLRADVRTLAFSNADEWHNNCEFSAAIDLIFGRSKPQSSDRTRIAVLAQATPPNVALTAAPGQIRSGETSRLAWTAGDADSCRLIPEGRVIPLQGEANVTPAETTLYTVECRGAGGTGTATTRVAVIPPIQAPVDAESESLPTGRPLTVRLEVEFATDSADIAPQYEKEIAGAAVYLQQHPRLTGVIEGHTDSTGSPAYNQELSQRRAESVRRQLIERYGIAPERLQARGYGDTRPEESNATVQGRHENRRIMAVFSDPDAAAGEPEIQTFDPQ